ncbi:hypothetical protein ACWGI8_22920 [Streptomyces sp. NPDC054841]
MSRILNGAVDARHLRVSPLAGRWLTGLPADPAPKKSEEEQWAPPEVVLQLARRLGPAYGMHVLTTAFTGLRWEELVGLHRRNALLERRQRHDGKVFTCPVIRIDKETGALAEQFTRNEEGKRRIFRGLEPPKNEQSARDIDIPPFLTELLEKHLADWPYEWVFCTPTGKWWWRSEWWRIIRPAADGKGCPVIPGGSARGVRCGASQGGGSSSYWAYSGDPTTQRGAVAVVVRPPGITGQPLGRRGPRPAALR